jgi:hypothetical protein
MYLTSKIKYFVLVLLIIPVGVVYAEDHRLNPLVDIIGPITDPVPTKEENIKEIFDILYDSGFAGRTEDLSAGNLLNSLGKKDDESVFNILNGLRIDSGLADLKSAEGVPLLSTEEFDGRVSIVVDALNVPPTKEDNIGSIKSLLDDIGYTDRSQLNDYPGTGFEYERDINGETSTVTIKPEDVDDFIESLDGKSDDEVKEILGNIKFWVDSGNAYDLDGENCDRGIVSCIGNEVPASTDPTPTADTTPSGENTVVNLIGRIIGLVNLIIPIIIGLGLIAFLWGVLKYGISSKPSEKQDSVYVMVYGIIALFVMVSIWGLVNVLGWTFFPGGYESKIETKSIPYKDLIESNSEPVNQN